MSDSERAAQIIQKHWKARQAREHATQTADGRWKDAFIEAQATVSSYSFPPDSRADVSRPTCNPRKEASGLASSGSSLIINLLTGENDPKSRLRRAVFLAGRLQDGEALPSDHENVPEPTTESSKILETQHWLELIDGKHRYGSNLSSIKVKYYHRKWQEEDTQENFFKWLDQGGGKDLSLPECSRERLEKERIIYLSKEQRANYLGLLRWARNNEYVDTRSNRWKDAGDGRGIIPLTPEEMRGKEIAEGPSKHGHIGFHSASSDSVLDSAEAHYVDTATNPEDSRAKKAIKSWFTSKGITERLLRKTLKKNTWIYVCDMKRNIFIGIKETGAFQHSSFTGGGLISSAGLIKVKSGRIHKLSPLSGHYRTSVNHYRLFLEDLGKQGADLSKVQVTKAEATLWGLEHYKRFQKSKAAKEKKLSGALKEAVSSKPKEKTTSESHSRSSCDSKAYKSKLARETERDENWLGNEQWRQDILRGRLRKETPPAEQRQEDTSNQGRGDRIPAEDDGKKEVPR